MKPGDLGRLRAAIFYHLQHATAVPLAAEEPWLDWLGVPRVAGKEDLVVESPGLDLGAAELEEMGILPEVVYSGLVQTWWHPQQQEFVTRTRSEIVACFDPREVEVPGWKLELADLERMNAYRLQELTPLELLQAVDYKGPDADTMEAWVLLCQPGFCNLEDVKACLRGELPAGVDLELAREVLGDKLFT